MRDRGPLLAAAVLAIVLVGLFLIGEPGNHRPLDPRSDDPAGTSALVHLTRDLGAHTELDVRRLDGKTDVALMLWDRLSAREHSRLRAWIRAGGTLVVTDPSSRFAPEGDGDDVLRREVRSDDTQDELVKVQADTCDITPFTAQGLKTLKVWGNPVRYNVGPEDRSCFGDGSTAYVVDTPVGQGHVVALGGSGIVVNKSLDKADNAPAIAGLLAPREGTRAAVIDLRPSGRAGSGDETLRDVMPTSAKRVIVQLAVAFLVYVIWRARRLGKPVTETQPVKVAASELVAATGNLMERSGSPQHAADVLRADLRRDLVTRLGLPPNMPAETFVQVVAGRTSLDEARLAAALGPGPVSTDGDLLAVATLIDIVRKEVFTHVGS